MSTLDAAFTAGYARKHAAIHGMRTTSAARPDAHEGERARNASRAERSTRRRQDAARRERDARRTDQVERSRDNAAARHPLALR